MSVPSQRLSQFAAARDKIITLTSREREGIGMQKEKTVHAILKNTFDPESSHQEIPLGKYIADVFDGERVTEIQSANFGALRGKLSAFLKDYKVTVVYPLPYQKKVIWIDPETGELSTPHKGPKGSVFQAFKELYRIRPLLTHPNLTVDVMMLEVEEYRVRDGWSADGKRGSHRYDRIPLAIYDEYILQNAKDYAALLPETLPEVFTSADLKRCAGSSRKNISWSAVLLMMTEQGAVERLPEKKGRSYCYRKIYD